MIYGLSRYFTLKKRLLTKSEKDLVVSVFGSVLQLEHIQIVAHRLVLKHFAISPNGHIYFNIKDWKDDFSQESILKQSWFIHEVIHPKKN